MHCFNSGLTASQWVDDPSFKTGFQRCRAATLCATTIYRPSWNETRESFEGLFSSLDTLRLVSMGSIQSFHDAQYSPVLLRDLSEYELEGAIIQRCPSTKADGRFNNAHKGHLAINPVVGVPPSLRGLGDRFITVPKMIV